MRRMALAFIIAVLTFSASGLTSLFVAEPCTTTGVAGSSDDGACPPTCGTCGCCAQAVEPPAFRLSETPNNPASSLRSLIPLLPSTELQGILHVPKLRVA